MQVGSEPRGFIYADRGSIREFLGVELLGVRVIRPLQVAYVGRLISSPRLHSCSDRQIGRRVLCLEATITNQGGGSAR